MYERKQYTATAYYMFAFHVPSFGGDDHGSLDGSVKDDKQSSITDEETAAAAAAHRKLSFVPQVHVITRAQSRRDTQGNELPIDYSPPKRNVCRRCCSFIYLQGSIIGPAPCHFIRLCSCSSCCTPKCLGQLNRSSFSTKLMYILFLGFAMMVSSFFIIVYPEQGYGVANLPPCKSTATGFYQIGGWWTDCRGHAGYFIVYRIFLAYTVIHLFLSFCTIGVITSTDFCRPGLHLGFWLCKILLFLAIAASFIQFITVVAGTKTVSFDEAWMCTGLAATVIFAIPQLIFILEIIEQIVIKVKATQPGRCCNWKTIYWSLTIFLYLIDIGIFVILCLFYTYKAPSRRESALGHAPVNYGMGPLCWLNIGILAYGLVVGILCTAAMAWHHYLDMHVYPNVGLLHSGFVFGHTLLCIYSALGNTPEVQCRVVWYPYRYNPYSLDVTFSIEGVVSVTLTCFTIIYFTLFKPLTTATAPLSKFLDYICCRTLEQQQEVDEEAILTESQIIVPDSQRKFLLLNDESKQLQYSWACFHFFLILGALNIMMGMTNYFHPQADGPNVSSYPAFWCKFILSPTTVLAFLIPIVYSWLTERPVKTAEESILSETAGSTLSFAVDTDVQDDLIVVEKKDQGVGDDVPLSKLKIPTIEVNSKKADVPPMVLVTDTDNTRTTSQQ